MKNHRDSDKKTQLNIDDADRPANVQGVASGIKNIPSDYKEVNMEFNSIEKNIQCVASEIKNISSDDKQVNIETNSIEKNVQGATSATKNIHWDYNDDDDKQINMESSVIEKNVEDIASATTNIHSDNDENTLVNMEDGDILNYLAMIDNVDTEIQRQKQEQQNLLNTIAAEECMYRV
ncbi:unnamed protein product, partial [Rotaria sp. Silwood2]